MPAARNSRGRDIRQYQGRSSLFAFAWIARRPGKAAVSIAPLSGGAPHRVTRRFSVAAISAIRMRVTYIE
jgi:hypothetical protein